VFELRPVAVLELMPVAVFELRPVAVFELRPVAVFELRIVVRSLLGPVAVFEFAALFRTVPPVFALVVSSGQLRECYGDKRIDALGVHQNMLRGGRKKQ
jgi:hypothetical protein